MIFLFTSNLISFGKPNWINGNVQYNDYAFYGVGSAKKHINGKAEQKRLALKRAIDEIALQKESVVENEIEVHRVNDRSYYHEQSTHKVDAIKIKSKIVEVWEDPTSKEIFVLVGGS